MNSLINSPAGLIHLLSATAALLFGSMVLSTNKGTLFHRRLGYTYITSMIILNATAFMIYRLFGTWGPFHYAAMVSTLTLMAGFVPVLVKRPAGSWIKLHISFMYYSVIGLYAAFASEVLVRIPGIGFWWMVVGATIAVMAAGIFIFQIRSKRWFNQFAKIS